VLPHEHVLVAFLPVCAYVLVRDRRLPSRQLVVVVFVGSQFPDLVDKPLAHQLGVIPSGRVFMHSLPFALPLSVLAIVYAWYTDRLRLGVAFAFAYLSHLLADHYRALLGTDPYVPDALLWPLVSVPQSGVPHWAGTDQIWLHLWTVFSVVVLGVSLYLFVRDIQIHFGRSHGRD